MKCKYCGEQLEKGIEVCKNCGRENKSFFNSGKHNEKIIIAAAVAIVAIVVALGTVLALAGRSDIDVSVIDEAKGEYLLVNVPEKYTFDIALTGAASGDEFIVYDIYGNEVATDKHVSGKKVSIKAPKGGYEEGDIYTLDLNAQGTFNDKELKDAKKITFVIEHSKENTAVYKNNVTELNGDDAVVEGDTIIVNGEFAENDIIVTDADGNDINEVYKLSDARYADDKTTAQYTEPITNEVFEELNFFYYDSVDLGEAEIDEEAFVGALDEMGILDAFVDEVYAENDFDVDVEVTKTKWIKAKGTYKFEYTIKDPKNESRQLKVSFEVSDKLMVKADNDIAMVNNTLKITSGLDFKVEGEDKAEVEKSITEAIKDYQSDMLGGSDKDPYDIPLGRVDIPIGGPIPIYATIQVGLTAEVAFSAEFNAGVEASVEFSQGMVYDIFEFEVIKKYADAEGEIEAYMMAKGKLEAFAGAYMDVGIGIPGIEITLGAKGGPYLESEGCFIIEGIPNDVESKGSYYIEIGLMIAADAKIDVVFFDEKSMELVKKNKPLFKLEGDYDTAEDYEVVSERKEDNVFINNDTEILVRTEFDLLSVKGNEKLNKGVKKWSETYEQRADDFIEENSIGYDEILEVIETFGEEAFVNAELYGTEYPVYSYSRMIREVPNEDDYFLKKPREDGQILSLIYSCYSEMASAVHGYHYYDTGNFDVKTGEKLSLKTISNNYEAFSDEVLYCIIAELEKKGDVIFEGYEDTVYHLWEENETVWYMSDEGLVFLYSPYTLASYAEGTIVVEVPYSEISEYIKERYAKQ